MIDTMVLQRGRTKPTPQIGLNIRVLVLKFSDDRQPVTEETPIGPKCLSNPRIIQFSEGVEFEWEGCLSIPGPKRGSAKAIHPLNMMP